MRLSELLKNDIAARPAPLPPPPPRPAAVQPPAAPPAAAPVPPRAPAPPTPQPAPPRQEQEAVEIRLRHDIEKEFSEKLRKMEEDLKRITEENLKGQEQFFQQRQEAIEKERQKLAGEVRDLKNVNEHLSAARDSMAEDFEKRMTEQRKQFQEQLQKSLEEIQRKQSEDLQVKLFQKEQELIEKKRQEEEAAKQGIVQPPPAAPAAAVPVPVPAAPALIKPEIPKPVLPDEIQGLDPKVEEKLRRMYQGLVQTGEQVFQYISRDNRVDLAFLKKVLGEVLELATVHDQEWLGIVLEPYQNTDYFACHSANCSILAMIIGIEMKLSLDEMKELALAAFVHDVGLLGILENLDYPKQLTPEIKAEITKHPQRSVDILGEHISDSVRTGILHHHETLNGKGYPSGFSGDEIHLFSKIIHLVDSFEAMTHHRPYRQKAMEVSEALKEMVDRGRGIYDRDVLKALMNRIGLYPVMSLVELSNKQIARVIRQCRKFPLSPVVKIEFDEDGSKVRTPQIIDLSKNQLIHVMGPVGTTHSLGKERQEKHAKREEKKKFQIWDLIPFALIVLVLMGLSYLFMKL